MCSIYQPTVAPIIISNRLAVNPAFFSTINSLDTLITRLLQDISQIHTPEISDAVRQCSPVLTAFAPANSCIFTFRAASNCTLHHPNLLYNFLLALKGYPQSLLSTSWLQKKLLLPTSLIYKWVVFIAPVHHVGDSDLLVGRKNHSTKSQLAAHHKLLLVLITLTSPCSSDLYLAAPNVEAIHSSIRINMPSDC